MTDPFPDVCACGCGRPPAGSYWYSDLCLWTWLAKVNDPLKLDEPVRTFCGSTYTDQPGELPCEVDPDSPDVPLPPAVDGDVEERVGDPVTVSVAVEGQLLVNQVARAAIDEYWANRARRGWLSRWLDRLGKGNQQ